MSTNYHLLKDLYLHAIKAGDTFYLCHVLGLLLSCVTMLCCNVYLPSDLDLLACVGVQRSKAQSVRGVGTSPSAVVQRS